MVEHLEETERIVAELIRHRGRDCLAPDLLRGDLDAFGRCGIQAQDEHKRRLGVVVGAVVALEQTCPLHVSEELEAARTLSHGVLDAIDHRLAGKL